MKHNLNVRCPKKNLKDRGILEDIWKNSDGIFARIFEGYSDRSLVNIQEANLVEFTVKFLKKLFEEFPKMSGGILGRTSEGIFWEVLGEIPVVSICEFLLS